MAAFVVASTLLTNKLFYFWYDSWFDSVAGRTEIARGEGWGEEEETMLLEAISSLGAGENMMKIYFKVEGKSAQSSHIGSRIWRSSQYTTSWLITIKLHHLETNLHRLSSTVNFLIFVKSNSKLVFPVELLSRSVRTLMINISSSKVPANTMDIHSVRNVCKLSSLLTRSSSQRRSPV